ncbi:MAG TPA: DUF1583 domain-containing protein, partial [Pirellulales bacterium]|nr:DUF1583 domain-containing protein [Pirellulales bacterium]
KTGRLRLSRKGDKLLYEAADEGQAEFRLVREEPFVDSDVKHVLFAVVTGLSKAPLTARLTGFNVRADALPLPDDSPPAGGLWIAWSLIGSAVILVACGAVVVRLRKRRMMAAA